MSFVKQRRSMNKVSSQLTLYQVLCLTLPTLVRLADPTHNDAKMKLAEIYEVLNEPRKALDLVLQGECTNSSTIVATSDFCLESSIHERNGPSQNLALARWDLVVTHHRHRSLRRGPVRKRVQSHLPSLKSSPLRSSESLSPRRRRK